MIQIIAGILFIPPAYLIIDSVWKKTKLKGLLAIIVTLINAFVLSFFTVFALVMWSWGGDKNVFFNHLLYSSAVTVVLTVLSFTLAKLIEHLKHTKLRSAWKFLLLQLLMASLICFTFIYIIPFINSQQEKNRQQEVSKLTRISDRISVQDITYSNNKLIATFGLNDLSQGSYSFNTTTEITAVGFTVSDEACTLKQFKSFSNRDKTIMVEIPYTFIRSCLNREQITSQNASINGLILTIHPALGRGVTVTTLSPVSVSKWIEISVTKSDIVLIDKNNRTSSIGW